MTDLTLFRIMFALSLVLIAVGVLAIIVLPDALGIACGLGVIIVGALHACVAWAK